MEGALAAEIAARDREQILTQTLADSQQALTVVQSQFKVGSTDLRFVEQRQLALVATRSALIRVRPNSGCNASTSTLRSVAASSCRPSLRPQRRLAAPRRVSAQEHGWRIRSFAGGRLHADPASLVKSSHSLMAVIAWKSVALTTTT